jgi:hypothetical protein
MQKTMEPLRRSRSWRLTALICAAYGCGGHSVSDGSTDAGSEKRSDSTALDPFSFFVTSYPALQRLSGSANGFGGDLRYGEPDGLAGADKICTEIGESSMPGSGRKRWRAFLSATRGAQGEPVDAIDRIGQGPWYDRVGRLVAQNVADLMNERPLGADPAIINDLPNEDGVPNQAPNGTAVDNHDTLTGSDAQGRIYKVDDWGPTCHDWTSSVGTDGRPRVGHSWPRGVGSGGLPDLGAFLGDGGLPDLSALCGDGGVFGAFCVDGGLPGLGAFFGDGGLPAFGGGMGTASFSGAHWISALDEAGCAPGASLVEMGPPNPSNPTVGSGGGYGGFYCFALEP